MKAQFIRALMAAGVPRDQAEVHAAALDRLDQRLSFALKVEVALVAIGLLVIWHLMGAGHAGQ